MAARGTGMDILTLSHVEKRFGEKQVLRDVDFSVPEHTVFGFVGKNGAGKTTLLRDLVRRLSEGVEGCGPRRVSLIDERGEVAVMYRGEPQMDVGPHTDVLDACPKALGIPMVLRAMNPQVIAVDEITVWEDIRAMSMAAGCGVRLLATIHAGSLEELREKPLYAQLLQDRVFRLAVRILRDEKGRAYALEELPC